MRTNSVRGPTKGVALERLKKAIFFKDFDNKPCILGSGKILKNRRLRRAIFKQCRLQESLLDQEAFWAQRLDSAAPGLRDINVGGFQCALIR